LDINAQYFIKDNTWHRPESEMDLNTNYTNDFTAKQGQRAQAFRPDNRKSNGAKFDGDTTYGQDWAGDRRGLITIIMI
jgi:hypothetical protein